MATFDNTNLYDTVMKDGVSWVVTKKEDRHIELTRLALTKYSVYRYDKKNKYTALKFDKAGYRKTAYAPVKVSYEEVS